MGAIRLENISTEFCLKSVNLEIDDGEFVVILGRSGAGKSTILNILAGFLQHSGNLYLDGKLINHVPTQKRGIGYLHQAIHLFPNLSVYENIAFGLKVQNFPKEEISKEIEKMANMLQISHLLQRYPKNLSGGEKQRVGIARSIVTKPKVLLLDEPLSSLDDATAKEIRKELKSLAAIFKLTVVYVTHDLEDAKELASKIIYIENGKIQKITKNEVDECIYYKKTLE